MEKVEEFLKGLGLTGTEIKVYLTLLEESEAFVGKISRELGTHRRNVYDALDGLYDKGMVTYSIKKGKKSWKCISPEKIKTMIKEKMNQADKLLPSLMKKYGKEKDEPSAEIYQGNESMKSFVDTLIDTGEDFKLLGASGDMFSQLEYYAPNCIQKMLDKNMNIRLLFRPQINSRKISKAIKTVKKYKQVSCKVLPDMLKEPSQIYILENYSAVSMWAKEPIAILIKSRSITEGFKEYFEYMWKISRDL